MTTITARFLSSIKDYAVYGMQEAGIPAGTVFLEIGNFAKECLQLTEAVVFRLGKLIRQLLEDPIFRLSSRERWFFSAGGESSSAAIPFWEPCKH